MEHSIPGIPGVDPFVADEVLVEQLAEAVRQLAEYAIDISKLGGVVLDPDGLAEAVTRWEALTRVALLRCW